MRIAVVITNAPFREGPLERRAGRLRELLADGGHEAELVRIPFCQAPAARAVDHLLAMRLLRLENVDRAIALGHPGAALRHADKVVWLLAVLAPAAEAPAGADVRAAITAAERADLQEATRVHAGSAQMRARFDRAQPDVLYPPALGDPRCDGYGEYVLVLAPARPRAPQRALLAALQASRGELRLVFAGPAGAGAGDLAQLVVQRGLERRVEILATATPHQRSALLGGARAVLCLADGERGFAEEMVDAFASRKGVVLFDNRARPAELVQEGVNGRIVSSVTALAEVFDELSQDAALAERYGEAGAHTLTQHAVGWETVVAELTR